MKLWAFAIIAAASVGSAGPAGAQRSIHIGVAGGGAFPVGILDSSFTAGPSGLVTLSFGSQDAPLGVRLDYQYDGFKGKALNGRTLPDIHINSVSANLVMPFRVGYAKPYLIGGAGLYPLRLPGLAKKETDWGFNGGGGIGFPIPGTTIGGFVEVRYHDVNRSNASPYHFVPVTLGLLF
jgi:outer membrane protein with beta-barrel domain